MATTLNLGNGNWAAKEGSLLAYNNENGNFKPLPFDFTRASSATRVNSEGLIEVVGGDQPRVDYSSGEGALLLEPSRSNLIINSENISGSGWGISGWTLTNDFISPDGTNNAYSILRTTGVGVSTTLSLLANTTYTFSAYIKNIDATNIQLRVQNAAGNSSGTESNCVFFQVTDQTNTDDFVRITHTFNTGDAGSYGIFLGYYSAGEYIVWGAQLEQGSYATSYIPTQGAAVTRVADVCSQTPVSGIIGQTEGTLFFEASLSNTTNDVFRGIAELNDGTTANRITLFRNTNGTLRLFVRQSSTTQADISYSTLVFGSVKIAVAYANNDISFYVNGVQVGIDTSATIPTCSDFDLGIQENNTDRILGDSIKQALLYNTRLSNEELAALTTI